MTLKTGRGEYDGEHLEVSKNQMNMNNGNGPEFHQQLLR